MSEEKKYRIWALTNADEMLRTHFDDPRTLNYKTGLTAKIHPIREFNSGYLNKVEYFSEYDDGDSKVLDVDIQYDEQTRQRVTKRRYVLTDGTYGEFEKVSVKYYTDAEWASVQVRRRTNIVDQLTAQAELFGVLPYVQTMFRSLDNELNAYRATGDSKIIEKITSYPGQWLNSDVSAMVPNVPVGTTLRHVIIGALTI